MPRSQTDSLKASDVRTIAPPFDLEPLFAANQRAFRAAAEAQSHMLARMTKTSSEFFDFVNRRLAKDRSAAKEFSRCQTPQDLVAAYAAFVEAATKDYSEEISLLAGSYADQAREVMEDAQLQVEEVVDLAARPEGKDAVAA